MLKSKLIFSMLLSLIIFNSCNEHAQSIMKSKDEVLKTEKEFEACVRNEGIAVAFPKFADENAVMNRNEKLLKGRNAIKEHYENKKSENIKLIWDAEFVDVSESGDLAYTYGNYTYTIIDSVGKAAEYKGIFHTVWKKQPDGTWKFVWD